MTKRTPWIVGSAIGLAVAGVITIAAVAGSQVSTTHVEASRSTLYSSLDELSADSAVVVVVAVVAQEDFRADDEFPPMRLSHVSAEETVKGSVSETLDVWQFGSADTVGPAPLLELGKTYLLYLTKTEVADKPGYYITGVSAGIWLEESGGEFRAADGKEGPDDLPSQVSLNQAEAAAR